jgi:Ca2+-binding EF-hand superfamily protein
VPRTTILIASAVVALSSAAFAQNQGPRPINRAEVIGGVDQSFKDADTNHDGYLSVAELQAVQTKELQQLEAQARARLQEDFRRLDTNKDGQLSFQEFSAVAAVKANETPQQILQQYDTNHDGKISAEEFRAPRAQAFDRIDTNHDGVISVEEQRAAVNQR